MLHHTLCHILCHILLARLLLFKAGPGPCSAVVSLRLFPICQYCQWGEGRLTYNSGGSSTITAPVRGIELSGERDTKKGNFIPPQTAILVIYIVSNSICKQYTYMLKYRELLHNLRKYNRKQ